MRNKKQIIEEIKELLFEIKFTRDDEKKKELEKRHQELKKEYASILSQEIKKVK